MRLQSLGRNEPWFVVINFKLTLSKLDHHYRCAAVSLDQRSGMVPTNRIEIITLKGKHDLSQANEKVTLRTIRVEKTNAEESKIIYKIYASFGNGSEKIVTRTKAALTGLIDQLNSSVPALFSADDEEEDNLKILKIIGTARNSVSEPDYQALFLALSSHSKFSGTLISWLFPGAQVDPDGNLTPSAEYIVLYDWAPSVRRQYLKYLHICDLSDHMLFIRTSVWNTGSRRAQTGERTIAGDS